MPVRLNRYLASTGVGSRRAADEYIRAGRVTVNGALAEIGTAVSETDDVRLDGRRVHAQAQISVLLNKPAGVVTTVRDPNGRPTVVDLVPMPVRLFPVGRLDRETTGALLLTNDGELADRLMHPRHGVHKTYVATVAAEPKPAVLRRLREGVELDDGPSAPATVRLAGPSAHRDHDPRGPQPPGAADAGRGRPSRPVRCTARTMLASGSATCARVSGAS